MFKTSYQCFPSTSPPPLFVLDVVRVFKENQAKIGSSENTKSLISDDVLSELSSDLKGIGFSVETGKRKEQKIDVPVLYGKDGEPSLRYQVDAFCETYGCGLEVEAGRSLSGGNAIYRDLFQALVMHQIAHMIIAVPHLYRSNNHQPSGRGEDCYSKSVEIARTLYAAGRIELPFGLTIIGY